MSRVFASAIGLLVLAFAVLFVLLLPGMARAETPVQFSIGPTAACALTEAGEIVCWGFDLPLVRDVPAGVFTDVSLGPNDGCAITADGGVNCWGAGYAYVRASVERILARDPEADIEASGLAQMLPSERSDFVQVVVHPWRHYACARSGDGDIACWGDLGSSNGSAPSGTGFTELINTGRGFCALDTNGALTCWGELVLDRVIFEPGPFIEITPSGNGVCGVIATGQAFCLTHRAPLRPGPPPPFTMLFRNVHILGNQGCAILDDGQLECVQTFHAYYTCAVPTVDNDGCPPQHIRYRFMRLPFTLLYEGGPDRETTASRRYVGLFGDQAACAIRTEGQVDCWSDFRSGDPRLEVPERFRAEPPSIDSEPQIEGDG